MILYFVKVTHRPPNFVKIDVEGEEVHAVQGMRRTIEQYAPTLLCEMHGNNGQMADLLDSLGYQVRAGDERRFARRVLERAYLSHPANLA